MKILLSIFFISLTILLSNCTKSDEGITHINCDGIITDTLGTGDTARIYMANAFTPNNDGLNDTIKPYTKNILSISFTVYDGYNNVVFSTNQLGKGWTGMPDAISGTLFFYNIQAVTSSNHNIGKCGAFSQLLCIPVKTVPLVFEDQITSGGITLATTDSLPACP